MLRGMKHFSLWVLVGMFGVFSAGCVEQASQPAPQTPTSQPAAGPAAAPAPAPVQPMPPMQQQQNIKQKRTGVADDSV